MSRLRTAERSTADVSRCASATVARERRPPSSVTQDCTERWSILASCQDSHCGSTWVRITDRSRAEVVASVFHDAIQAVACSPNVVRPEWGET